MHRRSALWRGASDAPYMTLWGSQWRVPEHVGRKVGPPAAPEPRCGCGWSAALGVAMAPCNRWGCGVRASQLLVCLEIVRRLLPSYSRQLNPQSELEPRSRVGAPWYFSLYCGTLSGGRKSMSNRCRMAMVNVSIKHETRSLSGRLGFERRNCEICVDE